MSALDPYIGALAVTATVKDITGSLPDAAVAGGFTAWIESITGSSPQVRAVNGQAKIFLTQPQIAAMQQWLDNQVKKGLTAPKEPPKVVYELGPVFGPWALKYALPAGVVLFIAGFIACYLWGKVR